MSECTVDYMEHALSLAELALGYTSPNPAVGAVIVKDGVVVGMGYTQPPGSAHAEIMALASLQAVASVSYCAVDSKSLSTMQRSYWLFSAT